MPLSFDAHEEGCRPLSPCKNCKAIAFLKTKFSPDDLRHLDAILSESSPRRLPAETVLHGNRAFEWQTRISNCLFNDGIRTLGDLVKKTTWEVLRIPGMGRHSLAAVQREVKKAGWEIGELSEPSS